MIKKITENEKLKTAFFLILLLLVAFFAGRMISVSRMLPTDANTVQYANAFRDGMYLEWRHELDVDETAEFLGLWHQMKWKADVLHKGNKNFENDLTVLHSITLMYLNQWEDTYYHYWIYFCDDNTIMVDDGIGKHDLYREKSGQYDKMIAFFDNLKYTQYDEEGNPIEAGVDEKLKELEEEAKRIQEELDRLRELEAAK